MQGIVGKVKSLLVYKKKVRIDNVIFVLHKVTAGVLFILSLIVTSKLYIGKPITCISDTAVERVIDVYCWIHGTYTLPEKLNSNKSRTEVAHPGVGQYDPMKDETRVHKYYQWVCFVLFFQAIAFYTPKFLWKGWESERISKLVESIEDPSKTSLCVQYLYDTLGTNGRWAAFYTICEILNFINVVVQIDLTDRFVGRAMSKYGFQTLNWTREDPMYRTDAMAVSFPTVTKCRFSMFGPSGNIVPYDALCVIPLNIYNEKFYPLLWFWFIALAVLSGLALIYRFTNFLLPEVRFQLLRRKFQLTDAQFNKFDQLNSQLEYGDWFFLYQIGKNISVDKFQALLKALSGKVVGPKWKGSNELLYPSQKLLSPNEYSINKEKYL